MTLGISLAGLALGSCTKQRARPGPTAYWAPAPVHYSPFEPAPLISEPAPAEPFQPEVPAAQPSGAQPLAPRRFASVQLLGVQMGLGKAGGDAWDFDLGTAPKKDDILAIAAALKKDAPHSDKIQSILGVFARPTARVVSKPDTKGSAALVVDGVVSQTLQIPRVNDTFSPKWKKLSWKHVAVDATTHLRVMLTEHDWKAVEPVTPFEITHADVAAALEKSGEPHAAIVADQTDREVLFVNISAVAE